MKRTWSRCRSSIPIPGPAHFDDGLVRHQHADRVHAGGGLPLEVCGRELARLVVLALEQIVQLRDERCDLL